MVDSSVGFFGCGLSYRRDSDGFAGLWHWSQWLNGSGTLRGIVVVVLLAAWPRVICEVVCAVDIVSYSFYGNKVHPMCVPDGHCSVSTASCLTVFVVRCSIFLPGNGD